ncbi:glycosyltransferase, partial [Akkermansiaceae bacterium]|nr:glycosyltransferase [Akkermansiaceae bacterium]
MSAFISVLINCYNGERFLREAIDSVYAQSYKNWEIVFVDNCSTDASAEIARSYDDRLKYYRTEKNISLGEARNFGVDFCGKYIATLDADDVWEHTALEILYKGITSGDFALCYGNQTVIDSDGKMVSKRRNKYAGSSGDFLEKLLFQFDIPMVATIIDKEKMLASNLNFNPRIYNSVDYSLFLPLSVENDFISVDA